MINNIEKVKRSGDEIFKYTLLIPTWNLLDYLKLCIRSIQQNSHYRPQIIIIVNDGSDGTIEWIKNQKGIDYIHSTENIGICYALNACRRLIATDYVVYANDDMYFLPDWDKVLFDEIDKIGHNKFMLSATMIESSGKNACCIIRDFGTNPGDFQEEALLGSYKSLYRKDWSGSCWPPNVMHIDCWDMVGGMSIEFSPGMFSDPDLCRKLWEIGVRIFIGKGDSLVYHFGCKSTNRIKKNKGNKVFTLKWGTSASTFMNKQLLRGQDAVPELFYNEHSRLEKLKQFIKRLKSCY